MSDETTNPEAPSEQMDVRPTEDQGDDVCPTDDQGDLNDEPEAPEEKIRPYFNYQGSPRSGSIWNSPLGLAATVYLATKLIDLAARVVIEKQKAKRSED
jgi:hypothetical protein